MSITSGFFNSVDGDRTYNAREMSMYFKGLISDGVFESVGEKFEVMPAEGMTVTVGSGRAMIDCQWVNNDAPVTLNINPCPVGKRRWDAIVLRLDTSENARNISLVVKEGAPVSTDDPKPPERTWSDSVKELHLCKILVNYSISEMSNAMFISYVGTSYCPFVSGLINQVSVEQFFAQYAAACEKYYTDLQSRLNSYMHTQEAKFNAWISTMTEKISVNTDVTRYSAYNVYTSETGLLNSITMPIAEYEAGDIIFIHIGGVMLTENDDYTISGSGSSAIITFPRGLTDRGDGVPISVLVLKSKSGGNVVMIDHAPTAADLTGRNCAIIQYSPSDKVVTGEETSIYNSVAVFVEQIN